MLEIDISDYEHLVYFDDDHNDPPLELRLEVFEWINKTIPATSIIDDETWKIKLVFANVHDKAKFAKTLDMLNKECVI